MEYSKRLRYLRELKNLNQEEMAKVINVGRRTYCSYEIQEKILPIKHLNALANFFNVSIDYLLGLSNIKQYKNIKKIEEIDKLEAGKRLKMWRKSNKITQVKLATILNTTFSSIAFNEKGRNLIATPFLYTICQKYHISADYLLTRIDEENPQ